MSTKDYDLRYLNAAAGELKTYLLSNELYWPLRLRPLSGEQAYPPMTAGNLLLFLAKLHGRRERESLNSEQNTLLQGLEEQVDALIQAWRTAWDNKVAKEFKSRFDQWKHKLEEMSNDPGNRAGYYKEDIRVRVLLELLAEALRGISPVDLGLLSTLDNILRTITIEAPFLWEKEYDGVFEREKYWYLYRITR